MDYLIAAFFLLVGLVLRVRIAWLRRRGRTLADMLGVLAGFALAAGVFLALMTFMCRR